MLHVASVAATLRKDVGVAGQNAWHGPCGAFTGEVAAEQLRDAGAKWVLLGHSERRAFSHESDDYVSTKVRHAQDAGLAVLACVGETLAERTAGATLAVVDAQMRAIAEHVASWGERLVIAYEPVWAVRGPDMAVVWPVCARADVRATSTAASADRDWAGGDARAGAGGAR